RGTVVLLPITIFVASLGNEATGAVGVVFSIQSIIQAIGYGFSMGAQSLISRSLGEKKREAADLYAASGFVGAFLLGLVIGVLGLINLPFAMRLFGATEGGLPYAVSYGRIILFSAPFFCSYFVMNAVLRAQGKAKLCMAGAVSGAVINIGLDALLIQGLNMGVTGAALATVMSQGVSFILYTVFFLTGQSTVSLNPFKTSRRIKDYLTVFRVGLPTVFRQSLGSLSTTLLNIAVRPFGDATFAAVSIANRIYMLLRGMLIGVGQGFQPVAGYNFGAGKRDRVKKAFNTACVIGTAYCFVASVVLFCFAENLIGLFRAGDAEVISIGSTMLRYLCFSLIVLGYSTFVNMLFQSLGFVAPATLLASCRQGIFFVPLILVLPKFFGLTGIQMTQSLADILTFLLSVPFHIVFMKKILNDGKSKEKTLI
ncbi:MAG: MATE family efflux transporter, partial [Clostridia bacterium]|nr:MATE family efflux transporter [Clostridia bacterium]